jgi:hypothetical protein
MNVTGKQSPTAVKLAALAAAVMLILSVSITGTYGQEKSESFVYVTGRVTGISEKYIEVDSKRYMLTEKTVIKDKMGNIVPKKALKRALKVKLEEKNGSAETIYILVKPE